MKHKLLILILFVFVNKSNAKSIISGIIYNAKAANISVSYYNDIFYIEKIKLSTIVDSNGKFEISLNITKPTFLYFEIGKKEISIYLKTNENLHITADFNNFLNTIKFKGKSATDNYFLLSDKKENFQFKANQIQLFNDPKFYAKYLDSLQIEYIKFYNSYNKKGVSEEVKNYLYNKMKYQLMDNRWMYRLNFSSKSGKLERRKLNPDYFNYLDTLNLNDINAYENHYYRTALMRFLYEKRDASSFVELDYNKDEKNQIKQSRINSYNYRKSLFQGLILDVQLTEFIKRNYDQIKTDSLFCDSILNDYYKTCTNEEYKINIKSFILSKNKLQNGVNAIDIEMLDMSGNKIQLSNFKGKNLYIDFWATWCMPCLINMPISHQLENEFKNIVFIYINIDDDQQNWLKYVSKNNEEKLNHFYINNSESYKIHKNYNFSALPHYILIDKNFKIYNSDAKSPTNIKSDLINLNISK